MTDNDIIKALECFADQLNGAIRFVANEKGTKEYYETLANTLDLINRKNAEIERLQNANGEKADYFSKLLKATKKKDNAIKRMAEKQAVEEFEKRVLSLFPVDKNFTTISRFSVKRITKEMIRIIKE